MWCSVTMTKPLLPTVCLVKSMNRDLGANHYLLRGVGLLHQNSSCIAKTAEKKIAQGRGCGGGGAWENNRASANSQTCLWGIQDQGNVIRNAKMHVQLSSVVWFLVLISLRNE